jgi:hypothetical protein
MLVGAVLIRGECVSTVSALFETGENPVENHEWGAETDKHKHDWLRKQSGDLATLMLSNFQALEAHFKTLQAEQKRLAE